MKTIRLSLLLLFALSILTGCEFNAESDGTAGTGSCATNNYGYAKFTNRSASNRTHYIYWDGRYQGAVKPNETQPETGMATKAGSHELIFKFNETDIACGPQTVSISKCSTDVFTCSN